MACGCPVVTTGREPMSEAGGDCAIYINPCDIQGAARISNEILQWNSDKRSDQIQMGYAHIKRFNRMDFLTHIYQYMTILLILFPASKWPFKLRIILY